MGGLLYQALDSSVDELGNPVFAGIRDALEQDHGIGVTGAKLVHESANPVAQQVVTEVHHERHRAPRKSSAVSTASPAQRRFLPDERYPQTESRAVSDGCLDLGMCVTDDDPDVLDPRVSEGLEPVEQHGLVGDRNQLLRALVWVIGRRRVPAPPESTRPLICVCMSA